MSLGFHEVGVFNYDSKWHQQVGDAIKQNPDVKNQLQQGIYHLPRVRASMDTELLTEAKKFKPDMIVYISAWEGDFVPTNETLGELNSIAPLVHMLFDGADPPWWSQLKTFEEANVFSLTVNIDGSHVWPGGHEWPKDQPGKTKNALTLLTPLDRRLFYPVMIPLSQRPYSIGYAGNAGGWLRSHLVEQLQKRVTTPPFIYRPRDDHPQSYQMFTQFIGHLKAIVSIPFTGSEATTHVKGRVLEAGMAGCGLLEWKNPATASWFTPRYEYEGVPVLFTVRSRA